MKKLGNAVRDFLYNITDYGLIIFVVVIMASILTWRFNILFNKGIEKEAMASIPNTIQNESKGQSAENTANPGQAAENTGDNKTEPAENETKTEVIATIKIPEGSFPSSIGDILVNSNLIDDKSKFLSRSVEMGLDTKLRSGTFDIALGTSMDNIIKIIANTN